MSIDMTKIDDIIGIFQGVIDLSEERIKTELDSKLSVLNQSHVDTTNQALSHIKSTIDETENRSKGLFDKIWGGITDTTDAIADVASGVFGIIGDDIDNPINSIQSLYDGLHSKLSDGISDVIGGIDNTVNKAQSVITTAFDVSINSIWGSFGSIFTELISTLKLPLDGMSLGIGGIRETLSDIPKVLAAKITEGTLEGANAFMSLMARDIMRDSPTLTGMMKDAGETSPILAELHDAIVKNEGQLAGVLGMSVAQNAVSSGLGQIFDQIFRPVGYVAGDKLRNTIISPAECVYGLIKYPEHEDKWLDRLHAWGFDDIEIGLMLDSSRAMLSANDLINVWRKGGLTDEGLDTELLRLGLSHEALAGLKIASYQLLNYQDCIDSWRRGMINDEQLSQRLFALGINSDDEILHKQLAFPVPPIQDIIRFAVREVFTPVIRSVYGLDNDLPSEFLDKAKSAGLSEEWAKAYWAAHWELPSATQGYEMLHRGIINEGDLDTLLKSLDYMPYWRDKLVQLNYNPVTRVDIRRLHSMGIITEIQVKRAYMDLGYNEQNAQYLTDFTIKLNDKTVKDEAKADKDLTGSEVVTLYKEFVINRDDAKGMLIALGYDETETEYKLTLADLAIFKEDKKLVLDTLKAKYQHGLIDYNGLVDELGKMNLPQLEMQNYLVKWEKTTPINVKVPTIKEMGDMVKSGIIAKGEMLDEVLRQGYSKIWGERMVKLYGGSKA